MFNVRIPKKFGRFLTGKQKKKKSAGTSNFWNPYVNIIATSYVFVFKKKMYFWNQNEILSWTVEYIRLFWVIFKQKSKSENQTDCPIRLSNLHF